VGKVLRICVGGESPKRAEALQAHGIDYGFLGPLDKLALVGTRGIWGRSSTVPTLDEPAAVRMFPISTQLANESLKILEGENQ